MKTRRSGKVSDTEAKGKQGQLDRKRKVSVVETKTRRSGKVSEKDKSSEIDEKLKAIELKEKQLKLREGQLDRKDKKITERFRELEADKEKLALREKEFEGRWRELEIFTVEVEEDRGKVADQLRELESRDVQLKERALEIEQIRSKCEADQKKLEERVNGFQKIKSKIIADWKKLDEQKREADQKEEQLGARVKSLDLLSKDLARQHQELVTNRSKLEADSKKLDERAKGFDLRSIDLVKKHKELEGKNEASWKKLNERIRELDHKERELDWGRTDLERERKELESGKRKLEADRKKLEERFCEVNLRERQLEGGLGDLEIRNKDLCRQRKELESDKKKFEADRKKLDEQMHQVELNSKEFGRNYLEEEIRKLELVKLKNGLEMVSKEIELKENNNLCKEIVMDGKTLQIFLNECWQNHEKMVDEVSFFIGLSDEPAKLVLDALEGFFPPHLRKGDVEFAGHIVQRSCILLLEQLLKVSPDLELKPEIQNEARRLSSDWITRLKADGEHCTEILGFLLVLANYGLTTDFDVDELFNYVKTVAHCEQVPNLCAVLGMADKIPGLIQDLVERKQHLVAMRYASYFNLAEKFPLDSLLRDHMDTSEIETAAIIEDGNNSLEAQSQDTTTKVADLGPAVSCIENDNISSEDSPVITSLEKNETEQTEIDTGVKKFAVDLPLSATTESSFKACIMAEEVPQLQQTGTDFSGAAIPRNDLPDDLDHDDVSCKESDYQRQAVVSTEDPLPKRRKLLDGKSTSTENADCKLEEEEEVCGSEKDLSTLEKHETEQTELAVSSYTGVKKLAFDLPLNATIESTFEALMAEEDPQLQQTGTDFPDIAISWDDLLDDHDLPDDFDPDDLTCIKSDDQHQAAIPTEDPLLERRKPLDGKITSTENADCNLEEEVCGGSGKDSLLKDHVETSKIESAAIVEGENNSLEALAPTSNVADLGPAVSCIENDNVSSEDSPANPRQLMTSPEKHEQTKLDTGVKKFAVDPPLTATTESNFKACIMAKEGPQLQQTGTDFSGAAIPGHDLPDDLDPDDLTSIPMHDLDSPVDVKKFAVDVPLTATTESTLKACIISAEGPQPQQTGEAIPRNDLPEDLDSVSSMETDYHHQAVISTEDPSPKRRKLSDGKNFSTENADSKLEEEVGCDSRKDSGALLHQNPDFNPEDKDDGNDGGGLDEIPEGGNDGGGLDVGNGVDYSEYFDLRELRFTSVDEAFAHANDIAISHGFYLVKASNQHDRNGRIRRILRCDRWGVYVSRANPDNPTPRKNVTSKKCDCRFAVSIVQGAVNRHHFAIQPCQGLGFHNHGFLLYNDGHRRVAAFTAEEKEYVIAQKLGSVQTKNIRAILYNQRKAALSEGAEVVIPSRRAFYNLTSRSSSTSRGSRNRAQNLLHEAREHNYIYFTKADEEGHLTHYFMVHPEAAKLYRAYPYVVLMDSTYKTNQYKRPVVEMIGVSPVGLNFLIAWALVVDETYESYCWVLECLKVLLPPPVLPECIVTDNDKGLIKAIEEIFPSACHLLCTFHIYNNVEKRALSAFRRDRDTVDTCVYQHFKKIVNAPTVTEHNNAWYDFRVIYAYKPTFVAYIEDTWIDCETKWARCFTNEVLHFRNTATSRVESAHAVFKSWMQSSTVGCDSMFGKAHLMIESQQAELRKKLSDSMGKMLVDLAGPTARLFAHLARIVTHKAILIMVAEYTRGRTLGSTLSTRCLCALKKTHGLPCACKLHNLLRLHDRVDVRDIHVFWRTLVYEEGAVGEFDDAAEVEQMCDTIRRMDPATFASFRRTANPALHPEHEDIQEPEVTKFVGPALYTESQGFNFSDPYEAFRLWKIAHVHGNNIEYRATIQ